MITTKYIKSDITDGLKLIQAGLNNLVSYVRESKGFYSIQIKVPIETLYKLLKYSLDGVTLDYDFMDKSIRIFIKDETILVAELRDYEYEFIYVANEE